MDSPNALENILLEHYGVDTSKLNKRRFKVWPKFSIIRNGEKYGTLPEIRELLGQKRIEGDEEVLSKMRCRKRRWQKRPASAGGTDTQTK